MAIVGAESEAVGAWPGWDTALPLLLPGHLPRRRGDCRGHGRAAAAPSPPSREAFGWAAVKRREGTSQGSWRPVPPGCVYTL